MREIVSKTFLLISLVVLNTACIPEDDWVVPEHFSTYDDPGGLYSISYPSDWRVDIDVIRQVEASTSEYLEKEGHEAGEGEMLFIAGLLQRDGYHPSVNIIAGPAPPALISLPDLVEIEMTSLESLFENFIEISRDRVRIDGEEAYIIDYEGDLPGLYSTHNIVMMTIVGDTYWVVSCGAVKGLDDFAAHADDFQAIVRSLQVYE